MFIKKNRIRMDLAEEKEASSLSYGDVVFRSSLGSKKMVIDGSRLSLDAHHEVRLLSISEAPRPSSMEGYPSNGVTRHPSRKSVLRGLSEALMRRSLTKVGCCRELWFVCACLW